MYGFVLPGDMNKKGLKVAKDTRPESLAGTHLGPGMTVVWGQMLKLCTLDRF